MERRGFRQEEAGSNVTALVFELSRDPVYWHADGLRLGHRLVIEVLHVVGVFARVIEALADAPRLLESLGS